MALQTSFSSSSSSSSSNGFSYDVFLSFRGTDTRHGFTGYLYKALWDKGIHTFIDDEELQRGEEIAPSLIKAIHESRIAIPVFSTDYASSSFCLDELVNIMECSKANGRLVLPVFYNVNPSVVRHQKGSYGDAIAKHEEKFRDDMQKVQKWRMALRQVAGLSGFHFTHGEDGYEHKFIEKIVKDVSRKIKNVVFPVAEYLVGLESRVSEVTSLLDVGSNDGVHIIGIHGIGGIGKTILAWAVYNQIANNFESTCFLEKVRTNSDKYGLVHLQRTFLSELLGEKKIKLLGVQQGISIIQRRLLRKKVFLILDDVDKHEQLQAIVGKLNWFGPSSKIIITTRDKHLLACHGVERTYELEGLDKAQALELLNWKAFKTTNINLIYMDVLNRAVTYACGLPLALEVLGSNLFGKSIKQWESTLDRYEKIPSNEILNILRVSFDALEEDVKSVFLDIACCFGIYEFPKFEDILHAHYGGCVEYHLGVLVEKSLIKFDSDGEVRLHDLIKGMGREIVRQESLKRLGKRSRLWVPEDIVQVLEDNQIRLGTAEIEIIHLDVPFGKKQEIEWDGNAFKKMKNLKTLVIRNCDFSEGPRHLPKSLRILEWENYPSQSLPCAFHPRELSILKLSGNCLTSVELAVLFKKLVNLKVLDLGWSECLTEIPDVSSLPNLEELSFFHCPNLTTIHSSVGFLDKLRILSVSHCFELRTFPPIKLTSLEELDLLECNSLENFPDVIEKMENITEISLDGTLIKELPFSFRNLTRLRRLQVFCAWTQPISFRMPSSLVMMPELVEIHAGGLGGWLSPKQEEGEETVSSTVSSNVERLYLRRCNVLDDFFPGLKWFANVKELCLDGNNFRVISACIKECRCLRKLTVDDCRHLREIEGVPPNLEQFSARNCKSLTSSCSSMLLCQELHEAGNTSFIVPAERIPEWLEHRSRGPSISFWFRNKLPAIALWVVVGQPNSMFTLPWFRPSVIINGKKRFIDSGKGQDCINTTMDHIFSCDLQRTKFKDNLDEALSENEWNHAEVSYTTAYPWMDKYNDVRPLEYAKECGILVFKQKSNMGDIRFTDPYKRRKLYDGLSSPESEKA